MSLTPQDAATRTFVFQNHPALPTPSPVHQQQQQQQRASFSRPTQGGIRPPGGHKPTYSTPYTPNNPQPGPARQNGNSAVSAEQQIAQGVLGNSPVTPGSNSQQQRRAPPLGTSIHMPAHGTPQGQQMNMNTPINSALSAPQNRDFANQRQTKNASPALQHQNLSGQRGSMGAPSPATPNLGSRPQDASPSDSMDTSQDLSMIDPQLALDHQLIHSANSALITQPASSGGQPIVQGDMLSPPPGGSYPTFEALFAAAQAHALAHGYAFVIGRSKRDNRGLKKVFLICDRGGTNKEKIPGEQRQRRTKSRKCGCEFGVFGLENKTSWILRGRIDGEHLTHNHPPSESPTEHPGARKLDPKAIAAVKALEENGVSVKETLEILHRESPGVHYLPRDIYNARAAIKRDPSRVEATAMNSLPTFYKKPPMTFEEKLRAELRTEVANAHAENEKIREQWHKEVEDLKEQLKNKDKMIRKFEMFIDICNERVMAQRELLADGEPSGEAAE